MSTSTPSTSSLLSYPTPSPAPASLSLQTKDADAPPKILKHRLYVGNLAPSVDEYTLVQVFSKYGKIAKLDFLFHKAGPMRGKPRGYAFVEYVEQEDAAKALLAAHDRTVRGRNLVVTFAHQAPFDASSAPPKHYHRRPLNEAGRPTTLSLLKTPRRAEATKDKIAMMEAKLRQMSAPPTLVPHASLPSKPMGRLVATEPERRDGPQGVRAVESSAATLPRRPDLGGARPASSLR